MNRHADIGRRGGAEGFPFLETTMRVIDGHQMVWFATYEPAGRAEGEAGGGARPAVDWSIGRVVFVSTGGERRSWLCAANDGQQVAAGTMPARTLRQAFNCARTLSR